MSNAERQKRYRAKKRNAQGVTDEIERVTVESGPQDGSQSTNGGGVVVERARKVPIPGDADYEGVCKKIDGKWVLKPDPPTPVADLSDIDLQLKIKGYPGTEWVNSPEHKEVLKRRAVYEPTEVLRKRVRAEAGAVT